MTPLELDGYSVLGDDWTVVNNSFTAPLVEGHQEQLLIFGPKLRNGSLTADITILDSRNRDNGESFNEAALVVRYAGPNNHVFAGFGGFGTKFFIGKAFPAALYVVRSYAGQARSVVRNRKYQLRVEFSGSRITLFENNVQQLTDVDETYQLGQVGFRTWNTSALFENVRAIKEKPKAFLIMPFKSEFDFVHEVIKNSTDAFGIDCVRADERAISRPVMEDVKAQIAEADLIIVDFTNKNPNVYYEAGLSDAMKKDWIILVQSTDDLAFDVRHIRCIQYSNVMGADQKLRSNLEAALEALGYVKTRAA